MTTAVPPSRQPGNDGGVTVTVKFGSPRPRSLARTLIEIVAPLPTENAHHTRVVVGVREVVGVSNGHTPPWQSMFRPHHPTLCS